MVSINSNDICRGIREQIKNLKKDPYQISEAKKLKVLIEIFQHQVANFESSHKMLETGLFGAEKGKIINSALVGLSVLSWIGTNVANNLQVGVDCENPQTNTAAKVMTAVATALSGITAMTWYKFQQKKDRAKRIKEVQQQTKNICNFFRSTLDLLNENDSQKFTECLFRLRMLPFKDFKNDLPTKSQLISRLIHILPLNHPFVERLKRLYDLREKIDKIERGESISTSKQGEEKESFHGANASISSSNNIHREEVDGRGLSVFQEAIEDVILEPSFNHDLAHFSSVEENGGDDMDQLKLNYYHEYQSLIRDLNIRKLRYIEWQDKRLRQISLPISRMSTPSEVEKVNEWGAAPFVAIPINLGL